MLGMDMMRQVFCKNLNRFFINFFQDYQKVLKEFEKLEELRLKMKEEKVKSEMTNEREDELKGCFSSTYFRAILLVHSGYAESAPMPGQQFDAKKRITVRNLR
jgi:hypothetical protein